MVARADDKENLVLPSQPVEQPAQGADRLEKWLGTITNRYIDDANGWGGRRLLSFPLKNSPNSPVYEIGLQAIVRNTFLAGSAPVQRVGLHDRPDIDRPRQSPPGRAEIPMYDEGSHGRAVPHFLNLVTVGPPIRVIQNEPTC
jgi:hypothetical protein